MQPPSYTGPVIELRDVVKRFAAGGSEIEILKSVSLQVHAGEFVAIVGPSGSGKSTLLNIIAASGLPACAASRVSVRASLAYE